ncbi:MAG TPA: glycosyltransferase family 2 protein [Ktedonobacteraceae bacterium]|nr:glycosyltransferase family 2 protein [Ktedonobacteraceae bacterium]
MTPEDTPMNTVHILIPVYKEKAVIKTCVEYFDKLARYPNVLIHYVTSEKEGGNSDTVAALKQMPEQYRFSHLHYSETDGFKAHQLNWAIKHILAGCNTADYQATYFGIYDVDSRPEVEVIKTILHGKDRVYQQPSIYLENYGRIDALQKAGALLQTKWELCANIPVLREYDRCLQHNESISTLPYCTGHGLFIRADTLEQVDLFDTVTLAEDLEFGYRSAFRGIPITLLKEVDYTQYAPTFPATIRQTSRWFSGEMNLYRYYTHEKKHSNDRNLKGGFFEWLVLKRYYTTLKWAFGAPLIYLAFLVLIIRYPLTILLAFLSVFFYVYLPFRMICNFTSWDKHIGDRKNLFALLLSGCIRPLLNSCGPFHYFLTTPINKIRKKPIMFVRTPKN